MERTPVSEMIGREYGDLLVLGEAPPPGRRKLKYVRCRCLPCGNEVVRGAAWLRGGHIKSCGCRKAKVAAEMKTTHGLARNAAYTNWQSMMDRCHRPGSINYSRYGGRLDAAGKADPIRICQGLKDLLTFVRVMGPKPDDGQRYTTDRVDTLGHYTCGQCAECRQKHWSLNVAWATDSGQQRNRKDTLVVTVDGKSMTSASETP